MSDRVKRLIAQVARLKAENAELVALLATLDHTSEWHERRDALLARIGVTP